MCIRDRRGTVSDLHERIVQLVTSRAYQRRAEPFRLASGQLSHDYIDGKLAIAHGDDLCWVADAVIASVTLVDRGDTASAEFGKLGIQYESLVNYTDLGIERIGPARPAPLRV